MKSVWSDMEVIVSMERPRGEQDLETSLRKASDVRRRMKARLKVEMGRVTFESRSRCPDPSRTCPTLQPPANNNNNNLHINHMTTQFLQSRTLGSQ